MDSDHSWSPELSFFPRRAPHEIVSEKAGQRLVDQINCALLRSQSILAAAVYAKLDPFRNTSSGDTDPVTYSIEVVPVSQFRLSLIEDPGQWKLFRQGLSQLFKLLRDRFDLVPTLIERKRDGRLVHWPGGGCHLHFGADLFNYSSHWYRVMEHFHRNLVMDYANRPYIRWLFSQWFSNDSNHVLVKESDLKEDSIFSRLKPEDVPNHLFNCAISSNRGIEPRYMHSSKRSYLTWEFRMFSMVANPDELRAIIRFLHRWVDRVKSPSALIQYGHKSTPTDVIPFDLTLDKLRDMKDLRKSRKICRDFIESFDLDWKDYVVFYERHYANRIRFGRME